MSLALSMTNCRSLMLDHITDVESQVRNACKGFVMHPSMLTQGGRMPGICGAFDPCCISHPREFD